VLKPVVGRYQRKVSRIYLRADAAFAMPEVYEFLEADLVEPVACTPASGWEKGQVENQRCGLRPDERLAAR
jgi:hypothetical protein